MAIAKAIYSHERPSFISGGSIKYFSALMWVTPVTDVFSMSIYLEIVNKPMPWVKINIRSKIKVTLRVCFINLLFKRGVYKLIEKEILAIKL